MIFIIFLQCETFGKLSLNQHIIPAFTHLALVLNTVRRTHPRNQSSNGKYYLGPSPVSMWYHRTGMAWMIEIQNWFQTSTYSIATKSLLTKSHTRAPLHLRNIYIYFNFLSQIHLLKSEMAKAIQWEIQEQRDIHNKQSNQSSNNQIPTPNSRAKK